MRSCGWGNSIPSSRRRPGPIPRDLSVKRCGRRLPSTTDIRGYGSRLKAGTTWKHELAFPRHDVPEACMIVSLSENRGRREDRVRAAPAVSRANCTKSCAHEHTGSAESIRPSLRNGFTAYNVLFPATGFLAAVTSRISPQSLTPASGRQNHTISPSASAALVSRSLYVHRIPPRVS